jgi:hypothetical protein
MTLKGLRFGFALSRIFAYFVVETLSGKVFQFLPISSTDGEALLTRPSLIHVFGLSTVFVDLLQTTRNTLKSWRSG